MKKFLTGICILLFLVVAAESLFIFAPEKWRILFPKKETILPRPLLVYSFPNLKKTTFPVTFITLGKIVAQTPTYTSRIFYFSVPKKPQSSVLEKVSGLMNIPNQPGIYPVIVMLRGFVPDNIYTPGIGTQPVAAQLASSGFITLAPDFLGFGESASGSADSFENRFQTYVTAATLLASLPTLPSALQSTSITADLGHIGIWGHSNGGHITLATLAITGVTYPTVLWAPVSPSFPYSILYYTDESDDQGKILRKVLSQFETIYNTDLFSPSNYYSWIKAPIEIDQGTRDEEVPFWWSDTLAATLKKNNLDVVYNTYPGADHNLLPTGWSIAVKNTILFYRTQFATYSNK